MIHSTIRNLANLGVNKSTSAAQDSWSLQARNSQRLWTECLRHYPEREDCWDDYRPCIRCARAMQAYLVQHMLCKCLFRLEQGFRHLHSFWGSPDTPENPLCSDQGDLL